MRIRIALALWVGLLGGGCPASRTAPTAPAPRPVEPSVTPPVAPPAPPDPYASLNLGFEEVDGDLPRGWTGGAAGYEYRAVTDDVRTGTHSLRIRSGTGELGTKITALDPRPLIGKTLRVHGWIKTTDVKGSAALWIRIDGGAGAFDNMGNRGSKGTTGWTEAIAEVDVPVGAEQAFIGAMLIGEGTAWFDDLSIEIVEPAPVVPIAIEGTVVDPAGAPAAGAEVALISNQSIDRHMRADTAGRFRFDATSGTWGVSAHATGGTGAFIAQTEYRTDARGLTIRLGTTGGVTVHGTITGPALPPGAYVQVSPVSEFDADLFAVPIATDGTFSAVVPRGDQYFVTMLGGGIGSGTFSRTDDTVEVALAVAVLAPAPQAVVDWIKAKAIPLASTEAGHGFADMTRIGALVGKARIVGLGEATHGSREFFQLKHRILEYLVAKRGFTVFAIEANQPECRAINAYVVDGKGDARSALAGIYFWTWNTEEVLAMIEWMRAWNSDPAHTRKVQFVGYDMQTATVAYASVAAYVTARAPADAASLLGPIAPLGLVDGPDLVAKEDQRAAIVAGLAAVAARFDANRKAWVKASSTTAYDDARHDVTVLQQATELFAAGETFPASFDVRDRSMADNIGWLLDHQPRGTKMVVWAHNGHIANKLESGRNMGSQLKARWKTAYVNLGFVFGQGSFQAMSFVGGKSGGLDEHTVPAPPDSHLSAAFSRTGLPLLVLDLRALPRTGAVATWFHAPHLVRETGAVFSSEQNMTVPQVLPDLYDAVIFVEQTTRARPLVRAKPTP